VLLCWSILQRTVALPERDQVSWHLVLGVLVRNSVPNYPGFLEALGSGWRRPLSCVAHTGKQAQFLLLGFRGLACGMRWLGCWGGLTGLRDRRARLEPPALAPAAATTIAANLHDYMENRV